MERKHFHKLERPMNNFKHGMSRSKEYMLYKSIIYRTDSATKNIKSQKNYVEKGITCCDRWKESFLNFLSDMGPCPKGFEIDRIDNKLGYFKENCRYVSRATNQYNRANFKGGLKGTRYVKRLNKFTAQICIDYHTYYLGLYPTEELAHLAYTNVAREWYGF